MGTSRDRPYKAPKFRRVCRRVRCSDVRAVDGAPMRYGTTAVASISTLASFSISATTCTTLMTGKCFPITAR